MSVAPTTRMSPYQGLTPFDERDAEYFFGREREARLIAADLFAAPVSLLYGASGVGKSSVLRAGVMPMLRRRDDLVALVFSEWQSEPLERLKRAILRALPGGDVDTGQRLAPFLQACAKVSGRRLMIVLDQFEEYSLYHPGNDEPFAEQFPEATALTDLSVSFLLSLREEAVARLDRFEGRIPSLFDNLRRIDHLSEAAARIAIELPLQKYTGGAVTAEPELVSEVLDEVRTGKVQIGESGRGTTADSGGRIEAPYLQLVMTRIWNEETDEGSELLRLTTFSRLGGAPKIVQAHLNDVMERFTGEERDIAARVFQQLVTPSGSKIAHSVSDLAGYAAVEETKLERILESLSGGSDRILRSVAELPDRPGDPRYEIFHDRLAPAILDWRSRHVKVQEATQVSARAEDERRFQTSVLRSHVEVVLDRLSAEERRIARRILAAVMTPAGVRQSISFAELEGDDSASALKRVLDVLTGAMILREEKDSGVVRWTLAHDTLIEPILLWRGSDQQAVPAPRSRSSASPSRGEEADAELIAKLLRDGRVVVVLGSGASASDRPPEAIWTPESPFLPTGTELQSFLASHARFPSGELGHASFSEIASYAALMVGEQALADLLDTIFQKTYPAARIHHLLAKAARSTPLIILTTTFDDLMESALSAAGVRFSVAYNTLDRKQPIVWQGQPMPVRKFDPPGGETLVYKLFGAPGSYLVTEEDDMELFGHIAEGRLPPPSIRHALATRHVLFVGMGLGTWPQRLLVRQLRRDGRDSRGWAVVRGLSEAGRLRWHAAHVEAFTEEIDDFARRLARAIGAEVP